MYHTSNARKTFAMMLIAMMLVCCTSLMGFATEGNSLDDVINGNSQTTGDVTNNNGSGSESTTGSTDKTDRQQKNENFIAGLTDASDLTESVEGVDAVVSPIKTFAAWIVQVLCYILMSALVLRIVLDLLYIGIPFSRSLLANGYQGNPQAGAGGMPNAMQGGAGMGGMGMGGMPGMGMGGMGMRGGYGMNRGMGMGMGGMGMGAQGGAMGANQAGSAIGRIQWVSNAALNAVAAESTVDPSGKAVSPFRAWSKDMAFVLILTPVFITLAVSGALTSLGFLIGDMLVEMIGKAGNLA